jgi:hypothetical protein
MTTSDPHSTPPRRFHWRTIPVGVIAAFGVIMLAFATFSLVYMSYTAWTGERMYNPGPPPGFVRDGIVITAIGALSGVTLLFASVQWWRGRWRLALIIVAALVLLCQMMSALGVMRD